MEGTNESDGIEYDFGNIQEVLIAQLNKLCQQSPTPFSKYIHVLPAANDDVEGQLEQQLQQEGEDHSGQRIVLIPYCLENSHWTGIFIELSPDGQIVQAKYIDPLIGCDSVPERLQQQLSKVYPSAALEVTDLHKQSDRRFSSVLTVKNLLIEVENRQRSSKDNPPTQSTDNLVPNAGDANTDSASSESSNSSNKQTNMHTSTSSGKEGNQNALTEKRQHLNSEMKKWNIPNLDALSQKIQETEALMREYEEENRADEFENEKIALNDLQQLKNLADEIASRTQEAASSENDVELKVSQMKEELKNELAQFKIRGVYMLLERIQKTEERIKKYEAEKRMTDVEKQTVYLKTLQRLQHLANEIARLSQKLSTSHLSDHSKVLRMSEELTISLAKLGIQNEAMLPQKIEETEQLIKEYEGEERIDDAEAERMFLMELQRLQSLMSEIAKLSPELLIDSNGVQFRLHQKQEELKSQLAQLEIGDIDTLLERIQKTEERIKKYGADKRVTDVEKQTVYLKELQRAQTLANGITQLNSVTIVSLLVSPHDMVTSPKNEFVKTDSDIDNTVTLDVTREKRLYINGLATEVRDMPPCARKTLFELLVHFETKLLEDNTVSTNQKEMMVALQKLRDQVKREELNNDDVKAILRTLEIHFTNENDLPIVRYLNELVKKFRSLNVAEIQRLVGKAREAGDLIQNKDVVLLIGTTGSGKSTTIQFLAGATMKKVRVEVSPGKFLEHVTAVGKITNPDLRHVISSPRQESETRYITPVNIQLSDILGAHETGVLTLCDAPGFDDTAGPEVDIANSIEVIEALKIVKSVKILALLSSKGLGDRGQGVQKLAHILISMVHGIQDKLDAIVYGFTKFSASTDINAVLLETKRAKVDKDPSLQSDTTFVSVLKDMIEKTADNPMKIEPTKDDPKKLVRKLTNLRGIKNPQEVFRFSMSAETRAAISDHVQQDKFSIICAMKHKDYELINYYLNDLQILKDLLKENFIRDVYEESVRFVSESISNYSTEIKEKFNRVLASQDGLQNKDILNYRTAINYLENARILKEHLQSTLVAPASMIQNIINQLNERSHNLVEEELRSPLVITYLKNLSELKNSFTELRESYHNTCKTFQTRLDELIEIARKLIPTHDFKQIADVLLNVYQSACVLQDHTDAQVQEAYGDLVKYLLRNLNKNSDETEPLFAKLRLSQEDVEKVKSCVEMLRSAKDTAALQERISLHFEMLQKKVEHVENYDSLRQNTKDVNAIYDEFIEKVSKHFEDINIRIKELFEKKEDHALEKIKALVSDMDALRTIPEIDLRTAATYYRIVENIRGCTEQLKADAEKLITALDQQTGITNFKHLARSLARLKNAEWINSVNPGTYDSLMQRITEELLQCALQWESNFMRLDLSLIKVDLNVKYPENISAAAQIVDKIESMRDLERSVPELEKYRKTIVDRFLQQTQVVFNRIQNTFNLEDKGMYQIKQKLKEPEDIKRPYESLHPAGLFLRNRAYTDIEMLTNEIEDVKAKQKVAREAEEAAKHEKESKVNALNAIIEEYNGAASKQTRVSQSASKRKTGHVNKTSQVNARLKQHDYDRIELVYDEITKVEKNNRDEMQRLQDQTTALSVSLHDLESIQKEHDSLLVNRQPSPEEVIFLREKGFGSYELLDEAIQDKTKVTSDRNKNKQTYHFIDRLEVITAESAVLYIMQCEKVSQDVVRENAIDTHEKLRKYIREYGIFLTQEINRTFIHTRSVDSKGGPFMYSQDLEMRLVELSLFSRYSHVSQCINASEVIERWHQEFLDFHRSLGGKMEEYKVAGKLRELRDQLMIAQALSCVDRFCSPVFAGNGFGVLYRQYQGEITRECRAAYKTVLEYISKGDYANADMAISDIEENPLNPRDKAQLQNDLHCSLNKLMKDTKSVAFLLDGKIERADSRDQIIQIKENIDKIRIASSKRSIMNLLDDTTQKSLQEFDNEIDEILAGIILRGLDSIETFMKADSFSEAEQGMETISQVQRALAGYCTSKDVKEKGAELRKKLDGIVDDVLTRNEFSDIIQFSTNPPKDLLAKLKAVSAHGSAKFTQAHTTMFSKTRKTFSMALEEAHKAPLNERAARIRSLNYALLFLPEELQEQFKHQIIELSKLIQDEDKKYRDDLEICLSNVGDNEHAIAQISVLAEQYTKQNMQDLLRLLREKCMKNLQVYRTNAQRALDEHNIPTTIDIVKKLLKYQEHVGAYVPEIKGFVDVIRALVIKKFSSCYETLGHISTIEQVTVVEKTFSDILVFLEYSNTSEKGVDTFFPAEVMQKADEAFHRLSQYFIDNSKNFQDASKDKNSEDALKDKNSQDTLEEKNFEDALKDVDVVELHKTMSISKKWQDFIDKIRECSLNHALIHNLLKEMREISRYEVMISELEQLIERLKRQLNVELFSRDTHQYEGKRETFFSNLTTVFNTLKTINIKLKDILPSPIDIEAIEKEIKAKVGKMRSQLMNRASKPELTVADADDFRMYYNHLVSFNKHFHFLNIDVDQTLIEAQNKILDKVELWKQAVHNSISEPIAVSSALVKIKFLAENLSMFDRRINEIIDVILKYYKEKKKVAGILSLSVELQKTDVGARLISEHSILSGEDLRLRRQKMHYQDNLDYALQHLDGTDLAQTVLRSRYKAFRQKYDDLVAIHLQSIKSSDEKEPDLEVLVAQTKSLVSTVAVKVDFMTWTRSFREDLSELLAHIFAIWTLKNTQHYNAMRGVKKANAYLLMPHVGQIIAIFRLLGLGYKTHKEILGFKVPFTGKTSQDSVNNLAEVGTGEGKSVVMAITACVFALTGIDVNCSCYSDILSTRDKNDFESVFRALGIEDRIQYGTFNKLCEQLLNEHCNVREKVRDMILTNKSTLSKIDTSARIRPKVLLIDEVDVFLSDKYYGGMYMPSVFLKDDAIKALLDSIWQNKNFKSLKNVQALPAYQTCATKFSNWMKLFDEVIKDMIAALQSYQSSTYLVQNDKIVYVDGESIVDNVVLGYDTVWAYYHENSKGTISSSSLQENVGILINCGRFSYAEMPHEFAYIGGVTGTLQTLAPVETKILEKVYAITQKTFIPSVFGSSNRTYNEQNDVRVVKESEYFMEICNEIRMMCDSKRAILVFFKSEDELQAFHKSSQLVEMKQIVQIITEKVSTKDRELYIKRAATVGVVTLLTRTFGRGTDFICRQLQLLGYGGIHVLQTFFSEELSEEYQIMGRGARQGDRGSYRMILLDKDLEWVLGSSWEEEIPNIQGTALYQNLHEKRRAIYESKCGAKELGIVQCKSDHEESKKFMLALTSADMEAAKEFLMKQNKGTNLVAASRTVLLMDATGSMSSLLSATKDTVCTMFERASHVLSEKGLPDDVFWMQFAVYRNYNCDANKILQVSSWNTKASNLHAFMTTIDPEGGMGSEAIEIGLWHAVNESETTESISQVILIGDAPANSQNEITQKRTHLGENYWKTTKFEKPTYYATELKKLKDKNIPVHTFYLTKSAQRNFEEIARETSGRSEYLDIKSAQGAELLTNFVTEEVLRKTAGDQGDAIVTLYRKIYVSHTS